MHKVLYAAHDKAPPIIRFFDQNTAFSGHAADGRPQSSAESTAAKSSWSYRSPT